MLILALTGLLLIQQGQNKKQDLTTFYALEIHVGSNAGKKENGNAERQYRLYSHFGNLTDAVVGAKNPLSSFLVILIIRIFRHNNRDNH